MMRSPIWRSWFISSLFPCTLHLEYKQNWHLGPFPYWSHASSTMNAGRSALQSHWSIPVLFPYICNKEDELKFSVLFLVYFHTDFIYSKYGIWAWVLCGAPGLLRFCFDILLIVNICRGPLWSPWPSSTLISCVSISHIPRSPLWSSWCTFLLGLLVHSLLIP